MTIEMNLRQSLSTSCTQVGSQHLGARHVHCFQDVHTSRTPSAHVNPAVTTQIQNVPSQKTPILKAWSPNEGVIDRQLDRGDCHCIKRQMQDVFMVKLQMGNGAVFGGKRSLGGVSVKVPAPLLSS